MEYITCISGTNHTVLPNNHNICYYVTALQIFHSSKTLNNILNDMTIISDDLENASINDVIISHLYTYNMIINIINDKREDTDDNTNTPLHLLNNFDNNLKWFYNKFVSKQSGYSCNHIIYYYILPCIYQIVDITKFDIIFYELGLDSRYISTDETTYKNIILTDSYLKNPYNNDIYNAYVSMINNIPIYKNNKFICSFMEIYGNGKSHTVTLIKGNDNKYYVIDNDILELYKYNVYLNITIELYNVSKDVIIEMSNILNMRYGMLHSHYILFR